MGDAAMGLLGLFRFIESGEKKHKKSHVIT
jgi:hypothetical protein